MATVFSFVFGTLTLGIASGVYVLVVRTTVASPPAMWMVEGAPAWVYTGGIFGAIYVLGSVVISPIIGMSNMFTTFVFAQLVSSLLYDHYGIMGVPVVSATPLRIAGVLLVLVAALITALPSTARVVPAVVQAAAVLVLPLSTAGNHNSRHDGSSGGGGGGGGGGEHVNVIHTSDASLRTLNSTIKEVKLKKKRLSATGLNHTIIGHINSIATNPLQMMDDNAGGNECSDSNSSRDNVRLSSDGGGGGGGGGGHRKPSFDHTNSTPRHSHDGRDSWPTIRKDSLVPADHPSKGSRRDSIPTTGTTPVSNSKNSRQPNKVHVQPQQHQQQSSPQPQHNKALHSPLPDAAPHSSHHPPTRFPHHAEKQIDSLMMSATTGHRMTNMAAQISESVIRVALTAHDETVVSSSVLLRDSVV